MSRPGSSSPTSVAGSEISMFGFKTKKNRVKDRISVYNSALFDDLVSSTPPPRRKPVSPYSPRFEGAGFGFFGSTARGGERSRGRQEMEERRQHQTIKLQTMRNEYEKQISDEDRRYKRTLELARQKEEEKFQATLQQIDTAQSEIEEISEYLKKIQMNEQRKKENLYKEWVKCVYEPIQERIKTKLSGLSTAEIEERRYQMYDDYIKATNRNQGIYRDIINPDEYDPLEARKHQVKISTKDLRDPLKKELKLNNYEKKLIEQISNPGQKQKKKRENGREKRLDILLWDKLDSTPHGRYGKMMEGASPTAKKADFYASQIHLDHFSKGRPELIKQEYFRGGKRVYPGRRNERPQF